MDHPICFRGNEDFGYLPNRIVENTIRVQALKNAIFDSLVTVHGDKKTLAATKLYQLIIHNSFGRVFPIPNVAADFIGIIDDIKYPEFQNCIALILIKGKLAVVGGFNDMGEAITQTMAREAAEEIGVNSISHMLLFSEKSDTKRDHRFAVISACGTGIINPDELLAGDDADKVIILPLTTGDDGAQLNTSYFSAGTHTDVRGVEFSHSGIRADHTEIIVDLFKYWSTQRYAGESLAETIKYLSQLMPQDWFSRYEAHPEGVDNYQTRITHEGKSILLTPNISFTLHHTTNIFMEVGFSKESAINLSNKLIYQLIKSDVLPLFPQAATTVDCVIVKGDNIIVHVNPQGQLSLPGTFYSPESSDVNSNILSKVKALIFNLYGLHMWPKRFLGAIGGTVALGYQADSRYPRNTFVYAGTVTDEYEPNPSNLDMGSQIIEIPIWKDKEDRVLSDEMLYGLDGKGWAYHHNDEILIPLLPRLIFTFDNEGVDTTEDILIKNSL